MTRARDLGNLGSDIGTAATEDITTSANDTTEGRLLKVGDNVPAASLTGTVPAAALGTGTNEVNWVAARAAGIAAGAVGSYAVVIRNATATKKYFGTNYAGSGLYASGMMIKGGIVNAEAVTAPALAGTWRCMGFATPFTDYFPITLFLRIS